MMMLIRGDRIMVERRVLRERSAVLRRQRKAHSEERARTCSEERDGAAPAVLRGERRHAQELQPKNFFMAS